MSTLPTTTPQNFWPDTSKEAGPKTHFALTILQNAVQQHDQAITGLKTQLDAAVAATTTIDETTIPPPTTPTPTPQGGVNNQTGVAYTTQTSDYGGIVTLDNPSAVSVSLNPSVAQFWFTTLENLGAGTVTVTPLSGAINNATSIALTTNESSTVFFDGENWWAATIPQMPQTFVAIIHQFLISYDASTGLFASAQPAFTDIAGQIAPAQLPSTGMSVTIATAALTPTGTQGSLTFTNGILTAQVPAT